MQIFRRLGKSIAAGAWHTPGFATCCEFRAKVRRKADRSMQLQPEDKALIVTTFRLLAADAPEASAAFYRHLFRIMPECRTLFVADIAAQGAKLAQTLQVIVVELDNWGLLRTRLGDLATRHLAYGVRPEHYDAVGQGLQAMLAERLGPLCTPAVAAAWQRAYAGIQQAMIEAAYLPDEQDEEI
jgi:nitric oxide dioxygenase